MIKQVLIFLTRIFFRLGHWNLCSVIRQDMSVVAESITFDGKFAISSIQTGLGRHVFEIVKKWEDKERHYIYLLLPNGNRTLLRSSEEGDRETIFSDLRKLVEEYKHDS